jgi:hypothetical protein
MTMSIVRHEGRRGRRMPLFYCHRTRVPIAVDESVKHLHRLRQTSDQTASHEFGDQATLALLATAS